jgi:hypothetical protein
MEPVGLSGAGGRVLVDSNRCAFPRRRAAGRRYYLSRNASLSGAPPESEASMIKFIMSLVL